MDRLNNITGKWKHVWETIGNAERSNKKKFFIIFAYPGISGYLHVGHMRGYSYADSIARYKRMQGYNVLFPAGTHASGNQAIAFANKVKNKDKEWIDYLKNNGCKEPNKLTDAKAVVDYFNEVYVNDYWKKFGFTIDYRRFTCTIYPDYNKFIEWQFKKLYDLNLLVQNPYYATFCPKCGPVAVDASETDISKGGNAERIEYTLLKFKFGDEYLVAATLRPETVFGQTNLWINPETEYAKVKVGNETWIISNQAFEKLKYQKEDIKYIGKVQGKEMIGKYCTAPAIKRDIIMLPASFCSPDIGTGIVTCVPSDAPYDYIALKELQENEKLCKEHGIDYEKVKSITLIPIIKSKGYTELPAKEIVEKMGIKSQRDIEKLEQATKEIYSIGFHTGVLLETCGKFAGMKVEEAKELMKEEMIENNEADIMYDLSEEVVCRCGEKVVIKKIDDQWFIKYSDNELTEKSKEHAKTMNIYPAEYKANLPSVLDWFQDRACARLGNWLGTKLPFDRQWTIEPISDSTLYPAYYIISPYVNSGKLKPEQLTEEFFDYVFLGKGKAEKINVEKELLEEIRKDFEYFYPLDINLGGKEHKTVHFPVFLMNHVAILKPEHWPKGIFVHWWVTGKGMKISKSKGGAEPIPQAIEKYSVDAMRLYYSHIGSPHADVVWDEEVVLNYKGQLERILSIVEELKMIKQHKSGRIDSWLVSRINERIKKATIAMENFELREAATEIYFGIADDLRWYLRRNGSNHLIVKELLLKWSALMSPITPHVAEEINSVFGNAKLAALSQWPKANEESIDYRHDAAESILSNILADFRNVKKLINIEKPSKATFFVAEQWKFELFAELKKAIEETRDIGRILKILMEKDDFRGKQGIEKLILSIVKNPSKMPAIVLDQETELSLLKEAKEFLEKELGCKIEIFSAEESKAEKARQAIPGKPAMLVE